MAAPLIVTVGVPGAQPQVALSGLTEEYAPEFWLKSNGDCRLLEFASRLKVAYSEVQVSSRDSG